MDGPTTGTLDVLLMQLAVALPATPKRYELRCHPDVMAALREAYPPSTGRPWLQIGHVDQLASTDVNEAPELGPGRWELYADGERIKSGGIGAPNMIATAETP